MTPPQASANGNSTDWPQAPNAPMTSWTPESEGIEELKLNEVLARELWNRQDPKIQTAVRNLPDGFTVIRRAVARKLDVSPTRLMNVSVAHGVVMLRADKRVKLLTDVVRQKEDYYALQVGLPEVAESEGPLNISVNLRPGQKRINVYLPETYNGALEEISEDLVLTKPKLAIVCCIISLRTVGSLGFDSWAKILEDSFWNYIDTKTRSMMPKLATKVSVS